MAAAAAPPAPTPTFALLRQPNPPSFSAPSPSSSIWFHSSYILISASISHSHAPLFALPLLPSRSKWASRALPVVEGEEMPTASVPSAIEEKVEEDVGVEGAGAAEFKVRVRPCELYVCNLPRSSDISLLLEIFEPYGTVNSVEISRDAQTGLSRGCGYVTMSSLQEAKAAIAALDKSDLGGREMRVKYSADMGSGRKNLLALNSTPKKDVVFESPHKVYVGNLAWSVRPEDLRQYFTQFGTVESARLLYDRKGGRNRVYGFVSFSSADELTAAIEASGSMFHGRTLLVREVINREGV